MRNHAMRYIQTKWMYIIDTDELIINSQATYLQELNKAVEKRPDLPLDKSVFVVTSWQHSKADHPKPPSSFEELKQRKLEGHVNIKHQHFKKAFQPPGMEFDDWAYMD